MFRHRAVCCAIAALGFSAAVAASTNIPVLPVGGETAGIAIDPALGFAFITNYDSGTLAEVDLNTLAVTTVAVDANPRRIVADAAQHRLYFVHDTAPGQVTVFSSVTNMPVQKIAVGDHPRNLVADFPRGKLFVSNRDSDSVSVIDVATNDVVANVPVGSRPGSLDIDRQLGRVYVPSATDGTVTMIDEETLLVIATVPVGSGAAHAAADERTGKVYVNNADDRTVTVLNGRDGSVLATLAVGAGSTFGTVSAVYRRYYLPNALDGTLSIVDTDNDTVVATLPVGDSPQQAIVDAAAGKVYVANKLGGDVAVIDARAETLIGRMPAGPQPWRLAETSHQLLALNDTPDGSVTVITQATSSDDTAVVTEYAQAGVHHYFNSADEVENRLISDGLYGKAWTRTMEFWRVWTEAGPERAAVCRFTSIGFDERTSHVFTPYATECDTLMMSGTWEYEGTAYYVMVPGADGACAAGTDPLYRLYNNGESGAPNHRYTADASVRDAMTGAGWSLEGVGPGQVFACVPPLAGSTTQNVPIADPSMGGATIAAHAVTVSATARNRVTIPTKPKPL